MSDVDHWFDEEEEEEIWDRIESPSGYDPGGGHYDPFSFIGSNTSLYGPAQIGENFAKNSMVPFPKMHARRGNQPIGGTKSGTARGEGSTMAPTIDTGDRWGWSNPVYKEIDEDFEKEGMNFSTPMKDSKFITELSRENLVALPIYQVALQYYYSAVANGLGNKDASSVIKIIERNANFFR